MTTTISISKSELLNRLQSVSKILSSKPALPIMSFVLLDIQDGRIKISAVDHQGRINTTIEGILTDNNLSVCFEPKSLIDGLKILPEQPLSITIDDSYNITVKYSGGKGKFELKGKPADEFPAEKDTKDAEIIEVSLNSFLTGINKTVMCSATDDLRPVMSSVYIDIANGQINHVASDGKVLALLEHKDESFDKRISFILPNRIASILKSILPFSDDKLRMYIGLNQVRFEYGSDSIVATLLEGNFPNYRSVIPQNNDKVMTVGTNELKSALSRVMVFSNQASRLVKFQLSTNQLLISGQDIDYSTCADESVACEYSGPSFEIGLNGAWLNELLSAVPHNEVSMSFSDPMRASLITPTNNDDVNKLTYLIMPLMLNS